MKIPEFLFVKLILGSFVTSIILAGCSSSPALMNLTTAKREVAYYYESGKYEEDLKKVIDDAINTFDNMVIKDSSAVIFDVDDTALNNFNEIKSIDFGYEPGEWDKWISEAKAPAIDEVLYLYRRLEQKGIHIIFLTGRSADQYEATYRNLVSAGYTKFDTLIVRSKANADAPAGVFKGIERIVIANLGYNIIGCVGDQPSDFQGQYVGVAVRLPNYMYLTD